MSEQEEKSCLIEAHDIVRSRNKNYGDPVTTAGQVARAFNELKGRELLTAADIPLVQMLYKIIRSEHGYKRDNNVDLAGYTDIRERIFLDEMRAEE